VVSLNVSSKDIYVCYWWSEDIACAEFDIHCVGLNFGELERHVIRAILVAHRREWTIVLTSSLSSQGKSKGIISWATQVVELVACLYVYIDWLTGSIALQYTCKVGCCGWCRRRRWNYDWRAESSWDWFSTESNLEAVATDDRKSGAHFKDTKGLVVWNSSGHVLRSCIGN